MNRLKEIREFRGITQGELGSVDGKKASVVSKYKSEKLEMNLTQVRRFARKLDCMVGHITGEIPFPPIDGEPDRTMPMERTFRSRSSIQRELEEIDDESIRLMRAFICRQPDPPNRLVMLEDRAEELRTLIADFNAA